MALAILILKFLHFLGLMLGGAAGFGTMAVVGQIRRNPAAAGTLQGLRPLFGRFGVAGIVLLWVSGLGIWWLRYGFAPLGPAYWLKLATATALLALILFMLNATGKARREGTPPPAWLQRLGMVTPVLTFLAVILAVWVFG